MTKIDSLPVEINVEYGPAYRVIYADADISSLKWWDIRRYTGVRKKMWTTYDFFNEAPLSKLMDFDRACALLGRCKTMADVNSLVKNIMNNSQS